MKLPLPLLRRPHDRVIPSWAIAKALRLRRQREQARSTPSWCQVAPMTEAKNLNNPGR